MQSVDNHVLRYCRENLNMEQVDEVFFKENEIFFKVSWNLRFGVSNNIYVSMVNAMHFAFTYLVLLILWTILCLSIMSIFLSEQNESDHLFVYNHIAEYKWQSWDLEIFIFWLQPSYVLPGNRWFFDVHKYDFFNRTIIFLRVMNIDTYYFNPPKYPVSLLGPGVDVGFMGIKACKKVWDALLENCA